MPRKAMEDIRRDEPFGTTDMFGTPPTFKDRFPTFDDWWKEVVGHSEARELDIDLDQESYRECYEDELEPWEAAEGE